MKNLTDNVDELAAGRLNRCKLPSAWGLDAAPSQHLEKEGANDTMGTKPLIVIKQQAVENPNLH